MKLGGLFGTGPKPLASKKTAAEPGKSNLAAAIPVKRKPGEFNIVWPKVKPQQPKDYRPILTKEDLIAYLERCEATGVAGFDWETAASQEQREAFQAIYDKYDYAMNGPEGLTPDLMDEIKKDFEQKRYDYLRSPLDPHKADICTVSLAAAAHESRVVPISHRVGKVFEPMLTREAARKVVMDILDRHLFRNAGIVKIAVNLSFETKFAARYKKYILGPVADPLMMWVRCLQVVAPHKLKDTKKPFTGWGLKPATKAIFGVQMNDFMDLLKRYGVDFFDEIDASQGDGLLYSAEDADYAVQHYEYWDEVAKQITLPEDCPNKNYSEWLHKVEMPFTRVIGLMEYHGMKWDAEQAEVKRQEAEIEQEKAANEIRRLVKEALGIDVNPGKTGKTKDVKEALFEAMQVPTASWGKTGPALDEEAIIDIKFMLENNLASLDEEKYLGVPLPEGWEEVDTTATFGQPGFRGDLSKEERGAIIIAQRSPHKYRDQAIEILENMVKIQKYTTLLSSHVNGREKHMNSATGRIHANYGPWTETSRLSSWAPNGQNVPRPDNDKLGVRGLYRPEDGKIFFFIDFSGFELRIMAWRAKDDVMIELFRTGGDMHRKTAAVLAEKPEDQVTKLERTNAKPGNFGISYGGTEHSLQKTYKTDYGMRKTLDFCLQVVNAVKKAYSGIPRFQRDIALQAREYGWVNTALGYIRLLPDINSPARSARSGAERQAANTPIQGSAADFMKVAQNEVYDEIGRGTNARYDFPETGSEEAYQKIKQTFPLAHGVTDMIAQIHDEMIFEMDDDPAIVEAAGAWVKAAMEREPIPGFPVPIEAEASVGYRWNKKVSLEEWKETRGA